MSPLRATVAAGILSAGVGVVSFHAFHALWISNVPAVLLEGILWALAAGSAVGWAFHHLLSRGAISADARGGLLFAVAMWLLLVPYEVVGVAFGPFTHLTRPVEFLALAPIGLLVVPFAAALGFALTRHARATFAFALAAFLSHFMVGSSLVYFGGRGAMFLLFAWMLPTFLASGLVLVAARRRFVRPRGVPA